MKTLFTEEAISKGARSGTITSRDGLLNLTLGNPLEPGLEKRGPNPELLFAGAYAACYHGALRNAAKKLGAALVDSTVRAQVSLIEDDLGGYRLAVELHAQLPGVDQARAERIMGEAHNTCPYSKALRGDTAVVLVVDAEPINAEALPRAQIDRAAMQVSQKSGKTLHPRILFLAVGALLIVGPLVTLSAQDNLATNLASRLSTNTTTANSAATNVSTGKPVRAWAGEQFLLPPRLKARLQLTAEQETELRPIEEDFAKTSNEYRIANQPRIEAAIEANRQARATKDQGQIQAARVQLQAVWAGLLRYRETDISRVKPLLTPGQLKLLEDPKNQWRTNPAIAVNNPETH